MIDPDIDWIPKTDGSIIDITENNVVIFEDVPSGSANKYYKLYDIDVEEVDNFIISGSGQDLNTVSMITHNPRFMPPCCFVAGTQISLSNGDVKNIEDVVVGDEVIGWNGKERSNGVVSVLKPTILGERHLYTINDLGLEFTDEHPFLTTEGWKAINPDEGFDYGVLSVGDKINHNGEWVEIDYFSEHKGESIDQPVYNFTVEDINSYIADGIVVHNK